MITIHHLGVSQSDRIVWLMEELELSYNLKWYHRTEERLAPAEYLDLHPAATAPVITDGDKTLTESAVIAEYICHKYADGKLTVNPKQLNYADYLYWMHFNNNILGLFFARSVLRAQEQGPKTARVEGFITRREEKYYGYLEQRLGEAPYLAGDEFTCADIMVMFDLTSLPLFNGRGINDLPNALAYVQRVSARPAYIKAMKIAGPEATPPKD